MEIITSTSNAQVKQLVQLQKKTKERTAQDVFVVEGPKMYRETPKERLVHTYVSERIYREHFAAGRRPGNEQGAKHRGCPVTVLSDRVFEAISDTKTPQGILCLVRQYHYELKDLYGSCPLILILENLQDPGNLGTILRTAEGAGATGILMTRGCVDIYNPKVIRSTMGSIYRMPFCYTDDLPGDLQALKARGVTLYAAHLEGSSVHDSFDYTGPSGFLIGNESRGLTGAAARAADRYLRIPMHGQVESLNAAVASAVLLYEADRQRRAVC